MTDIRALEAMTQSLEATGDYRVLRRMAPRPDKAPPPETLVRQGLVVDVETTGLDAKTDEIIELGMTPFTYDPDGVIYTVGESFQRLRQPSRPIPSAITAITGIDDAMVLGHMIDPAEVAAIAAPAAVVIAHNAAFDRRFLERFCDVFTTKPWGCSMSQVNWAAEGYEGTKLSYLAASAGFFYDGHRASQDCLATVELLARPLPVSGAPALARLLQTARSPTWRIWAENAPFDFKDILKARGYRWNGDGGPQPRAWYVDVAESDRQAELHFLHSEIYRSKVDLLTRRIDAHDRFSDRC